MRYSNNYQSYDPLCLGCPLANRTRLVMKDCDKCKKIIKEEDNQIKYDILRKDWESTIDKILNECKDSEHIKQARKKLFMDIFDQYH